MWLITTKLIIRYFMVKIGIIGVGHVGSHIASALIYNRLCSDLYLFDLNKDLLRAQRKDLEQGNMLDDVIVRLHEATILDLLSCDIVVNTASKQITDGDRVGELEANREIVKSIFKDFSEESFKGIIINVSNPCDVIACLIHKVTGIKANRIISTGTLLDSVRLKSSISEMYHIPAKDIKALVIGEHGKTQVNAYSNTYIYNQPIKEYLKEYNVDLDEKELLHIVTRAGWDIFDVKRATEFGIAGVTAYLIKQILFNTGIVIPYSHMHYYDSKLIYTSTPAFIGKSGFIKELPLKLNEAEEEAFNKSCEAIKNLIY